ncbi:hypothetical protein AQUCO_01200177v1 [Aquilegia coerulea]|uniref:Uncharacterized protein n=1 Tax=Aquilegia coerulea TaxID=218851 RepID=A0A2G5E5D0_AQUCA|nr:hypothetical protein AQUCO_01200177v1 [Aquilegia coerulea]
MFISHFNNLLALPKPKMCCTPSLSAVSTDHGGKKTMHDSEKALLLCSGETKKRISEMFNKVELSVSSYDTAWVAMVPSLNSPGVPYFPQCLNWVLDNQLPDGSWGLMDRPLFLVKDTLSSTLASVLALKRWNIGEEHVNNGIDFITSNFASATDEKQHTPIGFDIIFPGMIEYAQEMGINLHLGPTALNSMMQTRDLELQGGTASNSEGRKMYLAYVAEGLRNEQDWKEIMKYQRKNGSLFNSPSTTAAAAAHLHDDNCLNYLHLTLERFGNAVPTAYPLDIYTQLCMVDSLESLGIARYFTREIKSVLDKIHSCWLMKDEEIFLDIATCAMAFRILRMHGYDISSDVLAQYGKEGFSNTLAGYLKDTSAVLELYRASDFMFPDELFLAEHKSWSNDLLKEELSKGTMHANRLSEQIRKEVNVALNYPYYANLPRLENRRSIEHYDTNNLRILKTSYRPINLDNKDLLKLAVEDFNLCQLIHGKELNQLEKWVKEMRLDKLTFARQKMVFCYFPAAATLFSPELSDARLSWAKNSFLAVVVDDFYDGGGSREELLNLIELLEKWDGVSAADICSEKVEILFYSLKNTINEVAEKAMKWQNRDVTRHIVEIWLALVKADMKEAEWVEKKIVPTIDEFNADAYISFACGPVVLPAIYLVGHHISDEVIRSPEYHKLFKAMSRGNVMKGVSTVYLFSCIMTLMLVLSKRLQER